MSKEYFSMQDEARKSSFLGVMVRSSMNLSTDIIASTISGAGIIILIYIIGDILLSVLVDDYDDYS